MLLLAYVRADHQYQPLTVFCTQNMNKSFHIYMSACPLSPNPTHLHIKAIHTIFTSELLLLLLLLLLLVLLYVFPRQARPVPRWYRDPTLPVGRTEITRFPHAVLEVKLSLAEGETAPAWVTELLESGMLTEVHKFSKFIHGTCTLFPDMVQAVPYWVDDESVRPSMLMSAPAVHPAAAGCVWICVRTMWVCVRTIFAETPSLFHLGILWLLPII